MAYQSLYRRYRPQKFAEVRGQDHLVRALRGAVTEGRVGHAYLFSGPRGTGKTSTARILGKVLNCIDVVDGEPCGVCDSCVAIEEGRSFDVHELDAASNNGIEAIRDLINRAAMGSPGRTKVYILDEVHMLSTAASNALLKTLEEPPDHVLDRLGADVEPGVVDDVLRQLAQLVGRQEVHLELLGAAADGGQHLLGVGGGQHEHDVVRRLLERLQQRVRRPRREHVDLVEDVHLRAAGRPERGLRDQVADLLHFLSLIHI